MPLGRADDEHALRADGGRVVRPDDDQPERARGWDAFDLEELRRRNPRAVAMDLLYLFATAFFGHLLVRGFWPAAIAAVPLALVLYFGWRSSWAFFLAQIATIAATVAASYAGLVPL